MSTWGGVTELQGPGGGGNRTTRTRGRGLQNYKDQGEEVTELQGPGGGGSVGEKKEK